MYNVTKSGHYCHTKATLVYIHLYMYMYYRGVIKLIKCV